MRRSPEWQEAFRRLTRESLEADPTAYIDLDWVLTLARLADRETALERTQQVQQ